MTFRLAMDPNGRYFVVSEDGALRIADSKLRFRPNPWRDEEAPSSYRRSSAPAGSSTTGRGATEEAGQSSRVAPVTCRPSLRDRRFAAFLSHFKRECGTEARLVQLQLKQILPEDSDEVFLDSGAAAQLARTPDPR